MIDRENLISALHCRAQDLMTDLPACDGCDYQVQLVNQMGCDFRKLCRDAIELLKEQGAKPPRVHENAYGRKFYYCPKCNRTFDYFNQESYCHDCGQAVKWE